MRETIRYAQLSVNVINKDPNRREPHFYRTRTFRDVTIQDVLDEYANSPKQPLSMVYMTTTGYPHIVWHKDVDTDDHFFVDLPADEPITHVTDKEADMTFLYMAGVQIGHIERSRYINTTGRFLCMGIEEGSSRNIGRINKIEEAKVLLRLAYTEWVETGKSLRKQMRLLNLSTDEVYYAHPQSSTYGAKSALNRVAELLRNHDDVRDAINTIWDKVEQSRQEVRS